jgi:hypothetical protein
MSNAAGTSVGHTAGRLIVEKDPNAFESKQGHLAVTPDAIVFALTPEHRKQARECLERSGEIRISFQELSITSLTEIREMNGDGGVVVD